MSPLSTIWEGGTRLLQDGNPGWSTPLWVVIAALIVVGMALGTAVCLTVMVAVGFLKVMWFVFSTMLRIL